MAYTTKQQIENYLQIDISSDLDTQVASWIDMVEKYIDTYTDRSFDATVSIKKYEGGGQELFVDDLLSVTSIWMVENDATSDASSVELSTTDYYLRQGDNANRTPYNKIEISENGQYNYFRDGQLNILVEGSWGYSSTVPADIKMVATKLVSSIIRAGKSDNVKTFTEGDYSVTYMDFDKTLQTDIGVKMTLDMYRRAKQFKSFDIGR